MKPFRFIRIPLILTSLIILIGCSPTAPNPEETTSPVPTISVVSGGSSAYTIVRSDKLTSGPVVDGAVLIRTYARSCGIELGITTDWKKNPVSAYEIVVGDTTRTAEEGNTVDGHTYGPSGYGIRLEGSRIYITGGSEEAIYTGVETFLTQFFGYTGDPKVYAPITDVAIPADFRLDVPQTFPLTDLLVAGTSLREFAIRAGIETTPVLNHTKELQTRLYAECGLWLPLLKPNDAWDGPTVLVSGEKSKTPDRYEITVESGNLVIRSSLKDGFNRGTAAFFAEYITNAKGTVTMDNTFSYTAPVTNIIHYREFGAVGDGITNDFDAIIAAHAHANQYGLSVAADAGATYYIPAEAKSAIIQTDTDWTGAKFIFDDRAINTATHEAGKYPVFSVTPSKKTIPLTVPSLKEGATQLGIAPGVESLVYIECKNIRRYIRYGANANDGSPQKEVLHVSADGAIEADTPPAWDYPSVSTAYAIPLNETPITIQGGEFLTLANEINPDRYISIQRNIRIIRSRVTVENVKHQIEQTKDYRAAYWGFFCVENCADVTIKDCVVQCHKGSYFTNEKGQKVLLGSYEFIATCTNDLKYIGCTQTNLFDENGKLISQGLMGTNYSRNISMTDCVVARFDAHCQAHNVTIRGCTMERINLIGFGTAIVEDTEILDTFIFSLRDDYGSMFAGDVIVKNVTMTRENTKRFYLFQGAWYNHDFGYPLRLPRTVTVENLTLPEGSYMTVFNGRFDNIEDVTKPVLKDGTVNKNPLILPEKITVIPGKGNADIRMNESELPFPEIEKSE